MKLDNIEPATFGFLEEPRWKSRPSLAFVAIGEYGLVILAHIGECMAYLHNVDGALVGEMLFELVDGEHGLYIWEGRVRSIRHDSPHTGVDYDEHLEGAFRELNEDERRLLVDGKPLWSDADWHEEDAS